MLEQLKLIVFGTGELAKTVVDNLVIDVFCYLDNNDSKVGTVFNSKKVKKPSELMGMENFVIVIASMYYEEIAEQLKQYFLIENKDFFDGRNLYCDTKPKYAWLHEYLNFSKKIKVLNLFPFKEQSNKFIKDYLTIVDGDQRVCSDTYDNLYEEHSEEVLNNLYFNKLNKKAIKLEENSTFTNIHFIQENMYSKKFYDKLVEIGIIENNMFILVSNNSQFNFFENINKNIYKISKLEVNKFTLDKYLLNFINRSKKIYVHFLTEEICELFENPLLERNFELNWIMWGGDLYEHIDLSLYQEKTMNAFKYLIYNNVDSVSSSRKLFIQNTDYVLALVSGDFKLLKDNFKTSAKYKFLAYPSVVNFEVLDRIKQSAENSSKINILVGNSGSISNNHIEVFESLLKYRNQINKIYVPLSYGDQRYIQEISAYAKKKLGNLFHPLYEFMDEVDYANIVNRCDLVIMNHNRQQGVGNIIIALYLGKTVLLSEKVTTFQTFRDMGCTINSIEEFKKNKRDFLEKYINRDMGVIKKNQEILNTMLRDLEILYKELFN